MNKIRVGINGYGVIGRRVADAVTLQDDMELVGIADIATHYRVRTAAQRAYAIYAALSDKASEMRDAGLDVRGTLDDLLKEVEVVVDCTPAGIDAKNKAKYEQAGLKAIFQGGAKHALTGHSFVASANYESTVGRSMTRVVSCNTTATVRTLGALRASGLLRRARGVLIRRASDPWEAHLDGILNTMVPEAHIPSHQGPDAKTVIPDLDVITMAAKAAENVGHLHNWMVDLSRDASRDELLEAFARNGRIAFISASQGVTALNATADLMHEVGRPRGDMWEVGLWEDILKVEGKEAYYAYQVDNQAIVVPENIDAIRALSGREANGRASIKRTNKSLGIRQRFL
jgi:glyceraldehyde-3-phosphate dehydrogenase (NAD(P))